MHRERAILSKESANLVLVHEKEWSECVKKSMKQSTMINIINGVSFVILLSIVLSFVVYARMSTGVQKELNDRFELVQNANRFMNASTFLTTKVRDFAATGDMQYHDAYWDEVNEQKNREIALEAIEAIGITAEELALITKMGEISNTLVPVEKTSMEAIHAGDQVTSLAIVYGTDYCTEIAKIADLKTQFLSDIDQRTKAETQGQLAICAVLKYITLACVLAVIALQVGVGLFLRRQILRPIISVQNEMQEIAEGNLHGTSKLEANRSEIGMLVGAMAKTRADVKGYITSLSDYLERMAKRDFSFSVDMVCKGDFFPMQQSLTLILSSLRKTLDGIQTASDLMVMGTSQVATASQRVAQGASEQSDAVEALSASLHNVVQEVANTEENVHLSIEKTSAASQLLQESQKQMTETMQAMAQISQRSDQISGIIKTIDDIAFQTNILALNAAVEAARAGTAGKGFAVVADEVRNLAAKSAEAAKNTAVLIEETLQAVNMGNRMTQDTNRTMQEVSQRAEESTRYLAKIADAAKAQSASVLGIEQNVVQISDVINSNSANAEQTAAACQELTGQAEVLRRSIAMFRL